MNISVLDVINVIFLMVNSVFSLETMFSLLRNKTRMLTLIISIPHCRKVPGNIIKEKK